MPTPVLLALEAPDRVLVRIANGIMRDGTPLLTLKQISPDFSQFGTEIS